MERRFGALLLAALVAACASETATRPVGVRFAGPSDNPAQLSILVDGLTRPLLRRLADEPPSEDEWRRLARVSTAGLDAPPVLGRWEVDELGLVFRPRFPVTPGLPHRVVVDLGGLYGRAGLSPPGLAENIDTVLVVPEPDTQATTRVVRIWPSTDLWPANTLRFYVEFSASMGLDPPAQFVKLLDNDDRALHLPFVEVTEGLWDGERRRLTMIFHPGRIKRGVAPGEVLGPVLVEGGRYQIHIDRSWPDGNGQPLAGDFSFFFRAGQDDRIPPDPATWKITTPSAGSQEPLTVHFGEPLDPWLAARMIQVAGDDRPLEGQIDAGDGTRWQFIPRRRWAAGRYRLHVAAGLEDRAGNSPHQVFDRHGAKERPETSGPIELQFEIRGGS